MSQDSEQKAKQTFDEEVTEKASKAFDWDKEKDPEIKRKKIKIGMDQLKKILSKTNLVISCIGLPQNIILFQMYLDCS